MNTQQWADRLREWLPGFVDRHEALRALGAMPTALLHGSTALGVDDEHSDLDIWLLVSPTDLERFDRYSDTRFISFVAEGKQGHCNLHSVEDFAARVERCDFPLIAELRRARLLHDPQGAAADLQRWALSPMPAEVRTCWFRFHYVRMRQAHRACDNPIERRDAGAVVLALVETMAEAWRAAMVLDYEPYPYIKWLPQQASLTPTGRLIAPLMEEVLDLLAQDALRHPGPEALHPLSLKLREIRQALTQAAQAGGLVAPWLNEWWLEIERAAGEAATVQWKQPATLPEDTGED